MTTLKQNLEYFIDNQDELVEKYDGKVIIIRDAKVCGMYDSEYEAYQDGLKRFEPGTFSIQRVMPGKEAYTAVYRSRVRPTA